MSVCLSMYVPIRVAIFHLINYLTVFRAVVFTCKMLMAGVRALTSIMFDRPSHSLSVTFKTVTFFNEK